MSNGARGRHNGRDHHARGSDERGQTLIEVLLAVSILSIAFVAIIGGMGTSIIASDYSRKQATGQAAVRAFADAVKVQPYANCAATYTGPGYVLPAGYTKTVSSVEYWSNSSNNFVPTCPLLGDEGLQRVTVSVSSTDGRATETIQLMKRSP